MRLLRSEDAASGAGESMSLAQLGALAAAWYGDRLDPAWLPRTRDESQRILADVGLTGDFWELP